jgi:hypothetical protein
MNELEIIYEFMILKQCQIKNRKVQFFSDRSIFTSFACLGYLYAFCRDKNFFFEAKAIIVSAYIAMNIACAKYYHRL